jgi:hypothetical protein
MLLLLCVFVDVLERGNRSTRLVRAIFYTVLMGTHRIIEKPEPIPITPDGFAFYIQGIRSARQDPRPSASRLVPGSRDEGTR